VSSNLGVMKSVDRDRDVGVRPFRLGIVKDQDVSMARVRVVFAEFDHLLSYWLPIVVPKAQNDKAYWMPDIGEQVVCLMDERDEAGVVLGAIYSKADTTPVQSSDKLYFGFKDGAAIEYDRAVHALTLSCQDSTTIKYDGAAHVLALNFEDQAAIKYDSAAHALSLNFNDGTLVKYDAVVHAFTLIGGAAASVAISAPVGIVLQSGDSQVKVLPAGVSIVPPLE
jgi:phage baseplate assembly protein gpV